MTLRWPLTPHMLMSMCDSTQGSLCPTPMVIHQSMLIQWLFKKKKNQKVSDPKMTFDPTSVEVTCDSTQGSLYSSPIINIKVCGYSDLFFQKFEPKAIDP